MEIGEGAERMDAFLAELGEEEVHSTFDDCVDPAFAPGTGTPCPGGFSSNEALELVRRCAGIRLAGADLVEVLPDRDPTKPPPCWRPICWLKFLSTWCTGPDRAG